MSAGVLLGELRERGILVEADGLTLRVDAPEEADNDELREALRKHKRTLIRLLERERKTLEEADRRGLVIQWARELGYISLHHPTAGDWHEVKTSECPPWVLDDARAYHRRRKEKAAPPSPMGPGGRGHLKGVNG
ncbi:MAG: hypothetical protein WKF67_15245 [Rubrobacteraceae bacterium]